MDNTKLQDTNVEGNTNYATPHATPIAPPVLDTPRRRSERVRKPPIGLKNFVRTDKGKDATNSCLYSISEVLGYDSLSPYYQSYLFHFSAQLKPKSYYKVKKYPRWVDVMKAEIKVLEDNKTWEIVLLSSGKKVVGSK